MRFHFTTVPIRGGEAAEDALNQFLASHKVLAVERHLVVDGANTAWAVCVSYTAASAASRANALPVAGAAKTRSRVDYKEVLDPEQFAVFADLRSLRKELADRDGVPPYAIFNNEQLAKIVVEQVDSLARLGAIDGVGPSRVDKYGRLFLERLTALRDPPPNGAG